MKKNIYILSASDRYNYGDLLFPIIAIKELEKLGDYTFHNVSTTKSNLTKYGALKTYPYSLLYKHRNNKEKGVILVAGGEVLGANWSRLYSFINPVLFNIYQHFKNKIRLERITRLLLGKRENPIPFVPSDSRILDNFDIIFHSVGGAGVSRNPFKQLISKTFSHSIYFTVREHITKKDVEEHFNCKVKLTPDSAILMSEHYSFTTNIAEKYIAFQIGHFKTGNQLEKIDKELEKLSKATKLPVWFVPIGNCPGHDDIIPLSWLKEKAKYPCKIINPKNINTIMEAIAQAEIFIGTSLHGIITAMSFSTPYLGINPQVTKLKGYLEAWAPEEFATICDFKNICSEAIDKLNQPKELLIESYTNQKRIAKKSFLNIANSLKVKS